MSRKYKFLKKYFVVNIPSSLPVTRYWTFKKIRSTIHWKCSHDFHFTTQPSPTPCLNFHFINIKENSRKWLSTPLLRKKISYFSPHARFDKKFPIFCVVSAEGGQKRKEKRHKNCLSLDARRWIVVEGSAKMSRSRQSRAISSFMGENAMTTTTTIDNARQLNCALKRGLNKKQQGKSYWPLKLLTCC